MQSFAVAFVFTLLVAVSIAQDCTSAGFFREPSDCTRFYRCTDPWGAGNYQKFPFECPAGTVFDELVGVCNWPQLAAPCGESPPAPPAPGPAPLPPPPPPPPVSGTGDDIVVISPTFSFQCTAQGFFEHDSDCSRFWLCRPSPTGTALEPSLFRCPVGFLYDDTVRRCIRQEQAAPCDKVPDVGRIALEPAPYQLTVNQLEAFFYRFRFFRR